MRLSSYADGDDASRATKREEEVFASRSPLHLQTMQRAFFGGRQSDRFTVQRWTPITIC